MPSPPIPGSDNPPALPAAGGRLRAQSDDRSFETDIAALAGRFASRSGGGLSPELASDLALEIVLHEIAEQACLATGATGAAIVLHRDGELVCRARSGKTVPELGSRLAAASGISADCIRTRMTQRCDDIEADPRADVDASRKLGVLSVLVMPLLRGDELAGIFELFSSRTYAFGDREERALEALAQRTLKSVQLAAQPMEFPVEDVAARLVAEEDSTSQLSAREMGDRGINLPAQSRRVGNWIWTAAVVASTVLLAVAVIVPSQWKKPAGRGGSLASEPGASGSLASGSVAQAAGTSNSSATGDTNAGAPPTEQSNLMRSTAPKAQSLGARESQDIDSIPAGSLSVYSEGKEVFHEPASGGADANQPSAAPETVIELSPAPDAAILLKRVAPEYPAEARRQHRQGAVVLDVQIGAGGDVDNVRVVSGPPDLAAAASDAMKRWKFKPRLVNGAAQEMKTQVTVRFRLPQ
jgi:TonB family protein